MKNLNDCQLRSMSCQKHCSSSRISCKSSARSAQTTGTATSYINAIVSSGSLTEAISRISAMNEIADANNKMLQRAKT